MLILNSSSSERNASNNLTSLKQMDVSSPHPYMACIPKFLSQLLGLGVNFLLEIHRG